MTLHALFSHQRPQPQPGCPGRVLTRPLSPLPLPHPESECTPVPAAQPVVFSPYRPPAASVGLCSPGDSAPKLSHRGSPGPRPPRPARPPSAPARSGASASPGRGPGLPTCAARVGHSRPVQALRGAQGSRGISDVLVASRGGRPCWFTWTQPTLPASVSFTVSKNTIVHSVLSFERTRYRFHDTPCSRSASVTDFGQCVSPF